ncbi:hypothetical protein K491DRAFT_696387 [Lophiostoma macrostomum CBS 122681]|uniref:DUF6604 domain-containing protein n=1 Tax=Lophiostoma macrostomum CBS 122681 TaxID=1314788 RepID=A0A6A6SVD6_9PLEO|nr:hypothetical protein K491DRAFT_696387 [Lophiostoma macrostomum CBS 122681]
MARAIASFEPKVDVPKALEKVFNRAIEARRRAWSWFQSSDHGYKSNKRHSYFITVLEIAIGVLRPLIPLDSTDGQLNHVPVENRFVSLAVEETDPLDDLIPEVRQHRLPKVTTAAIEQDEDGIEEEFFFAIKSFLKELDNMRMFIWGEWLEYSETGQGLTRAALLTNTAVDFVRSAEYQLEHTLKRPKRYPANQFPVWTLPALVFYRSYEIFHDKPPDLLINPSMRLVPETVLHGCDQERYCFCSVYAALKFYLSGHKDNPSLSLHRHIPHIRGF